MVTYLHLLDENKKENITVLQNDVKKVLIKLKRLQELFPEKNEKITSYINRYETWGKIVETIELQGTSQGIMEVIEYADHILNKQKARARKYHETKEEVSNKDKLELYSEMEMLEIFASYLLDDVRQTEEQSTLEEVIENHILEKKNQINSFFHILDISGRLSFSLMSQNQQDVFQMEEMIENYFQAQEVLVIESFHPIYSKVQEYVKVQCQEIESWDPQMMQIVREDYLDIPKEKLLKKV